MDLADAADTSRGSDVTAARAPALLDARAERWQHRFYLPIKAAACLAIAAVVFHIVDFHHVLHTLSLVCAWTSWSIFAAEVAVMLRVSPMPAGWARRHRLDIGVLLFACPLWPVVFSDLYLTELLPSVTLFDATVLAKLFKGVRALRRRDEGAERRAAGEAAAERGSEPAPASGPPRPATADVGASALAEANSARAIPPTVAITRAASPLPAGEDHADGASESGAKAVPVAPPSAAAGGDAKPASDSGTSGAGRRDIPTR